MEKIKTEALNNMVVIREQPSFNVRYKDWSMEKRKSRNIYANEVKHCPIGTTFMAVDKDWQSGGPFGLDVKEATVVFRNKTGAAIVFTTVEYIGDEMQEQIELAWVRFGK